MKVYEVCIISKCKGDEEDDIETKNVLAESGEEAITKAKQYMNDFLTKTVVPPVKPEDIEHIRVESLKEELEIDVM